MCSSRESVVYSSHMQARTRREPAAMCLRLLSLMMSFHQILEVIGVVIRQISFP